MESIVSPITYSQIAYFQVKGLRQQISTLLVMMAYVLSLIWRLVGSVTNVIRDTILITVLRWKR